MPDFAIRITGPDDKEAISHLLQASYPVLFRTWYDDDVLAASLPLMTQANLRLLGSGMFFVAESCDRQAVGCGGWSLERPGSGEVESGLGHIRHFAVHPGWLRKGIGGALLEHCLDDARARGITGLERYSSLPAEAFYRAGGFTPVETIQVDLGRGVRLTTVVMRRTL
jgi:GNAT superfamily N-acetyltransferase